MVVVGGWQVVGGGWMVVDGGGLLDADGHQWDPWTHGGQWT